METKLEQINGINTVFLSGEVDLEVADQAKEFIANQIVEGVQELHLNLKDVSYMDSSGISILIESHQKGGKNGTKVILKEVSKSVLKVIMMAKLELVLNIG